MTESTASGIVVASPLLRIVAYALDSIILTLLFLMLMAMGLVRMTDDSFATFADAESVLVVLVVQAIYYIGFTASAGATPGKMAMRIVITDLEGRRVQPDTAILRYVILLVENLLFFGVIISLMMLVTDRQRRTIHDRVARTLVVKATSLAAPTDSSDRFPRP